MTWLDIAFLILLVVFIAMGAKLGSLWTGACLIGGFLGGFLADYYALPLSGMMGSFPQSEKVATVLLFLTGVTVGLLPGWILSRLSSGLMLGLVDSVFGLVTGVFAFLIAMALASLFLIPRMPQWERSKAWNKSLLVKPFNNFVEGVFNDEHFRKESAVTDLKDDFVKDFSPVVKKAEKSIKSAGENLVEKIKK